ARPAGREGGEPAWTKVWKSFDCSSLGMPMPLSSTVIWKYPAPANGPESLGACCAGPARTEICPPAGVNFTALERRLTTHWRILSASTWTFWMLGETSVDTVSFFLKLCGITDSPAA